MTALYVLRRELKALATLPQTYAIAGAYLLISGIFFVNILVSTEVADLGAYYTNVANTLLVLVPVVAMRSFAEERRSGALEISLSWPASKTGMVLGKFVANTVFVWLLASVVWLYFSLVSDLSAIAAGRTAGGYIGLLLMAAAFSALALAVSARVSSTTAAAFLGFGLLLFLWILDYAPGWIGDTLRLLGPAAHFEAFPRGVIYAEDVAYFAAVTAFGLGGARHALGRELATRTSRSLARRGAALGLVLSVGLGGAALADEVEGKVDLTGTGQNTLTGPTRKVLGQVRQPVRLTAFARPFSGEEADFRGLVKQYRAAGADITAEILDPDVQPGRARRAGVTLYGEILVEIGDRQEVIDGPSEGALTSALHRLSATTPRRACFTIGHGERSLTDETRTGVTTLAAQLRSRLFYEVETVALGLAGAPERLSRCTVVIAAGPRVRFLPEELGVLDAYTRDDGRLIVMAGSGDAGTPGDDVRLQLNGLLSDWGVAFGAGTVADLSALAADPASVVSATYPSSSPATLRLRHEEVPVVFVNSAPVETEGAGAHVSPLVRSSAKSWTEPNREDGRGPFTLAAVADDSRLTGDGTAIHRTRIAAVGSVEVASNRGIELLGNGEFTTALVQWVARDDDLIAAVRPPAGLYKLVLTEGQRDRLIRTGIALPSLAVLLPLPLTITRLRRG